MNAAGADTPGDSASAIPTDATGMYKTDETGELLCQESLEGGLVVQKSKEVGLPSGGSNGISNDGHTEAITTLGLPSGVSRHMPNMLRLHPESSILAS